MVVWGNITIWNLFINAQLSHADQHFFTLIMISKLQGSNPQPRQLLSYGEFRSKYKILDVCNNFLTIYYFHNPRHNLVTNNFGLHIRRVLSAKVTTYVTP